MEFINRAKYCLLVVVCWMWTVGTRAQQRNVLCVPDAKVSIGQAQLPVAIENTDEIIAAQFDLTLPSTIMAGTDAVLANRCDGHTVLIRNISATRYRVMLYSHENRPLIAQSGTVFYIPLTIPQTVKEGSELPLVISNATLTVAGGANVLTDTKAGKLIVSSLPDLTVKSIMPGTQEGADARTIIPGERLSLSWQVQNVGGSETGGGWSEQILLVNKRGTVTKLIGTVYQQEKLPAGAVMSRQADIIVPQLLGIEGEAYMQVKVIANSETGESVLATGNNLLQADEAFHVEKRLFVEPNPSRIVENYGRDIAVKVSRSGDWSSEQTFTLSAFGGDTESSSTDSRITLPSQVTLPIGQSGAVVYMKVADNQVLDADSVVYITAKGNNYAEVVSQFIIEDNEYPDLSLTASNSVLTEGETFQLTVSTQRVSTQPITVTLSSENTKRFSFPQTVTIPAGDTSVIVDVIAIEDDVPSLDLSSSFTASAPKFNRAEVIVLLKDNDLPTLELQLTPTTVSESAGPVSVMAVLRRLTHTDQSITVKLTDNSQNGDINYGHFSSISMAKGVEKVSFTIGVNDNLIVDGNRDVMITAAVYIHSCSCSAETAEGVGAANQTIHIVDNDGPSLSIASSSSMLLEGAEEATVLTVTRNTSLAEPLNVKISSSYDEGLVYSHSVVIPAGSKSVTVKVQALANTTENDNVTVTFTASAAGHNDGTCWAMISDQTMPDAIVSTIELLTENGEAISDNKVMVNSKVKTSFTVKNIGVINLPAGAVVTLYQNSKPVATMTTSQPLAPQESTTFTYTLAVPNRIGTISVYAVVNEDEKISELLYVNNTSPTVSAQVSASFTAIVNVDKNIIQYGDSLTVSGHITPIGGTTWQSDYTTPVDLYLIAEGQRYVQRVQADVNGTFSFRWGPARYQMGHVSIGACYPGEDIRTEMAGVDIYGMRWASNYEVSFYTILDQPYQGSFAITNPGRLPLTNFAIEVTGNPDDADITFDAPETIEGGQTVYIGYTLTGHQIGGDNEWQTVRFSMTTAEGPNLEHTLYYYTRSPQAQLSCSIKQINTTMTKGNTRDISFDVANIGLGNTGLVTLALPAWMQSVTPKQMASMSQGDTTQVIIRLAPTDDMQLNVPVTGQIAVNCENGNGLTIPFVIEPVSESTGGLVVDVCDEYTYYTDEAPHVSGATVSILHPSTGAVVARDITDDSGCYSVILPEGYYTLLVTHPNHSSYRANIQLDPGKTTYKTVNLSYDAIEVNWDVVETTVEDVYDIVTTVNYETQVPVPVVTVNMPQSIEAHKLDVGQSLIFYAVMTNKGMIAAQDVQFSMPEGFVELSFEPLDNADPFELAPQQSAIMPIKVTRLPKGSRQSNIRRVQPLSENDCYAQFPLAYFYECGTDRKYHKYYNGLRVAECEGKTIPLNTSVETGSDDSDGGGGWGFGGEGSHGGMGRPNSPGNIFGTSVTNQSKVSTGEPYQCSPCSNSAFMALAKMIPLVGVILDGAELLKDAYNCGMAFQLDDGLHDKLANCKFTAGVVNRYDRFVNKVHDIYDDVENVKMYGNRIANHIVNNQFFTKDCLDDWKGIYNSFAQARSDMMDLSDQTLSLADDVSDMMNKADEAITECQETERIVKDGLNRTFDASEDVIMNRHLDLNAAGLTSTSLAKQEADAQKNMSEVHELLKADIAGFEDYKGFLGDTYSMLQGKTLNKNQRTQMTKKGIKIFSDLLYRSHNATNAKSVGFSQDQLKLAYVDNTNKLLDKAEEIGDLIHYSFGDCEYEGTESAGSGDETEAAESLGAFGDDVDRRKSHRRAMSINFNSIPASYKELVGQLSSTVDAIRSRHAYELEYFGAPEWLEVPYLQMAPVSWAMELVEKEGISAIETHDMGIYCPDGISEEMLNTFLRRWYYSIVAPNHLSGDSSASAVGTEGRIDTRYLDELNTSIRESLNEILKGKEESIEEAILKQFETAYGDLTEKTNSVCASITLQFNQTMTMTRQAFRGTLKVHNGNSGGSMENIILQLEVRNTSDGRVATSREMYIGAESLQGFEGPLNLTDGWTLAPNGDGTATILFIPSKYAAPTEPVEYSFGGSIKYLDPYTNTVVTRELSPVTLIVKPSPELDLTYFMQRDIYGDDPLTLDVVEPIKPAEFALIINNKGYGDATNVRMVTQQPEIIENEKGLKIDFELISSQLNGGNANLSFGKQIANDFGTIPAHSQMYAQWWLTSSLLGHFTDYNVEATHVTSYGNEDLSLLDQVTIHDMIHSFDMPEGSLDGGPEIARAYLVNDIVDANDMPDKLYFTNGDTARVVVTTIATVERTSATTCLLTVTPTEEGWNYGSLLDPTHGYAELKSIVRQSDGQELGNTRFWQTDRTLRDGKDWLYEYRLHFVDEFKGATPETYLLTFDPMPEVLLEVTSIGTIPEEGQIAEEPINALSVVFNKQIEALTFTGDDILFAVQGVKQDAGQIVISSQDNKVFTLDMSAMNEQLPNGYYTLTVQTSDIIDAEGYSGKEGKQVNWILFRGGLVQLLTSAWPENAGTVNRTITNLPAGAPRRALASADGNTAPYGSNVTLVAVPENGYMFANWSLNGEVVSTEPQYTVAALGDMNVVANFTRRSVFIEVAESEGGHIEGLGTGYYLQNSDLVLTAVADEDFMLTGWVVNGEKLGETSAALSIQADKEMTIKALFEREYYRQSMMLTRGWNWVSSYIYEAWPIEQINKYAKRIVGQFNELINDPEYGLVGNLNELTAGMAYKVETQQPFTSDFRGHLLTTPVILKKGWNWVPYPWTDTRLVSQTITNAEEGDYIVSQQGFTEYADGYWEGSMQTLTPGFGYLYKSVGDKVLKYDFTDKSPDGRMIMRRSQSASGFDVSTMQLVRSLSHSYPNSMCVTACIEQDGVELKNGDYIIYAMNGDEMRGVGEEIDGRYYVTVFGDLPVGITFIVENVVTGEQQVAQEQLSFHDDVVGRRKAPFVIHVGDVTGIESLSPDERPMTVYSIEGVLISRDSTLKALRRLPRGVYIVNGQKYYIK